jgi:hypothetical protein
MTTILKRNSRRILLQAKWGCSEQVHSDQMVLRTIIKETGPRERWAKALKTKLTQGVPSGSSLLRSDGSSDGQAGGWTL